MLKPFAISPLVREPLVHEDVRAVIEAVIPPRHVPWRKRLFWAVVLRILRSPRGRAWLATRYPS